MDEEKEAPLVQSGERYIYPDDEEKIGAILLAVLGGALVIFGVFVKLVTY